MIQILLLKLPFRGLYLVRETTLCAHWCVFFSGAQDLQSELETLKTTVLSTQQNGPLDDQVCTLVLCLHLALHTL